MDFFDKLTYKVTEGSKILSKKTDELIVTAETMMDIKKIQSEIEEAKIRIGDIVYRNYLGHNVSPKEVNAICRKIEGLNRELNHLEYVVNQMKGVSFCKHCSKKLSNEENYCPACGSKVGQ
ncbi:MAG: hypothetical protein ACOYVK_03280 [Bacillota bacterium]